MIGLALLLMAMLLLEIQMGIQLIMALPVPICHSIERRYMNSFKYDISLRVWHPTLDPDYLSQYLGLTASRKWKAGERRMTPKGDILKGTYEETYCVFSMEHTSSDELVDVVEKMTEKLSVYKTFICDISKSGGKVEYFIGWYSSGNSGQEFSARLIKDLADLDIGLSFDFYGGT